MRYGIVANFGWVLFVALDTAVAIAPFVLCACLCLVRNPFSAIAFAVYGVIAVYALAVLGGTALVDSASELQKIYLVLSTIGYLATGLAGAAIYQAFN